MRGDPKSADERDLAGDLSLAAACALGLAIVLFFAFAPAPGPEVRDEPAIGQVVEKRNDVRVKAKGHLAWGEAAGGTAVRDADTLYAAPRSRAIIHLDDGAQIEVEASSLVVLRRAPQAGGEPPKVALELVRGGARGVAGAGPLHIVTGGAEVAVGERGEVRVRQRGGAAAVEVSRGEAVLESAADRVTLHEGQRADEVAGRAKISELEVGLSEPADGATLYFDGPMAAVRFAWSAPSSAPACAVEISPDGDFSGPLDRLEAGSPASHRLPAGLYHWRVRCGGPAGEVGSPERTFVLEEDRPPVPISPVEGQFVDLSRSRELAIWWSEVPGETAYRVELAPDGAFERPAVSLQVPRASARLEFDLPEGRYCYRVRGEGPLHAAAPWSSPACFRAITRPVLEAPKVYEPRREPLPAAPDGKGAWLWNLLLPVAHAAEPPRSALVLRWEQIPGATGYLLEIAEDRAFKRIIVRENVKAPVYRWEIVARRDYYWRVRGIDEAGREGSVSEIVKIGSEVSPPALLSPAAGARLELGAGGVSFAWKGGPVFKAYRVELAEDRQFGKELAELEAEAPKASWRPSRAGTFFWRVVGIDVHGQSTEPSEVRALAVVASAPEPRGPQDGLRILADAAPLKVMIRWGERPVGRYEVELAGQGPPKVSTTAAPELELELRRAGRFSWRVRGLEPQTAWSSRRAFEIAIRAPAPEAPADGANLPPDAAPTLAWAPVPLAGEYEVELAAESGAPMRFRTAEPTWSVPPLAHGRYRWRVRALAAGSSAGSEPSPPFAFSVQEVPAPVDVEPPAAHAAQLPRSPARIVPPAPGASPLVYVPVVREGSVAAIAGVSTNFGALTSPTAGFEVAWRRRADPRVGFGVRASQYAARQEFGHALAKVQSELWAMPIEVVGLVAVPLQRLELVLSVGPLARVVVGRVELVDGTTLRRGSVELGAVARAALELPAGPGWAWVEMGGAASVPTRGLVSTSPGMLTFCAGYRLEVW